MLSAQSVDNVQLRWRKLGDKEFAEVSMDHVARGRYAATFPDEVYESDFEYYAQADLADSETALLWPPTAPDLSQTVVVMP